MALKDVIRQIPISLPTIDFKSIAAELGFNYRVISDTECVMYLGDNSNNGYLFQKNSNAVFSSLLYCNGEKMNSTGDGVSVTAQTASTVYLSYIKGKDTVTFGITGNGAVTLQFVCGRATNVIDGIVKYGYCCDYGGNYAYYGNYVMSDGYYKRQWFNSDGLLQISDYFAYFYQMCSHQGDLFDNIYVATIFKQTTDYQLFTLNNKDYVSLNTGKNTAMRYITEF